MSLTNTKTKIIIYATLVLSAVCAALRAACTLFFYEGNIGYYASGALLPVITDILFWLSVAALIFLSFFYFRKNGSVGPVKGMTRYFALLPATAFLYPLAEKAKEIITELKKPFGEIGIFSVLIIVSILTSIVFFALIAFSDEVSNTVTVIAGVGVILWLALCWIESYGDFFTPMNSPDKTFFHFACVGSALFIVGELRALCSASKPRSYFSYLAICILSTSSFVISNIFDRINGISLKNASSLAQTVVIAAILVYAVARACSLLPKAEKPAPEAQVAAAESEIAVEDKTESAEDFQSE